LATVRATGLTTSKTRWKRIAGVSQGLRMAATRQVAKVSRR
jgi:hypothetical protein